ncbi:pentapeptide repeat-containing protein [Listeria monocytogenes]|nr:pentapeptide repeat-containing protein [Listeria monocytogenes]
MNQAELDVVIEKHEKWLRDGYGERANLSYANLSYADLSYANLRVANLSYADLSCANLRGANLRGANLSYADLSCADLRGANLRGANLSYADLSCADLNWVNWQHVEGLTVICVQVDTSRRNNQIAYIKELDIWTTGCFQGTLDELKASVEQTHKYNEKLKKRYYRVIDFILREAKE